MQDREKMSRRDFIKLVGVGVAGAAVAIHNLRLSSEAQTPEGTQEVDPFAETDQENKELIQSMIAASKSNILSAREMAEREFELTSPRILTLVKLNIQPFAPDVNFGILSDSKGKAYALIYNHDMDCVRAPLGNAGLVGETFIEQGPAKGTIVDPGVSEIHFTEIGTLARPETLTVERFIDNYRLIINDQETVLPVLIAKGFVLDSTPYDCATIQEKIGGRAGEIVRQVQNGLNNVELGETLESVGEALGSALGNLAQGTGRGFRDAFGD